MRINIKKIDKKNFLKIKKSMRKYIESSKIKTLVYSIQYIFKLNKR